MLVIKVSEPPEIAAIKAPWFGRGRRVTYERSKKEIRRWVAILANFLILLDEASQRNGRSPDKADLFREEANVLIN